MESFVSIGWEGRYIFEHLPTVFGWLKELSELRFFSFHTENISDLMHWVPFPEDFERFPEDTPDRFWPR